MRRRISEVKNNGSSPLALRLESLTNKGEKSKEKSRLNEGNEGRNEAIGMREMRGEKENVIFIQRVL